MQNTMEKHIIQSWHKNAEVWTKALAENSIESRINVTNKAILDTIIELKIRHVLDIGCGEGWLVRALEGQNIIVSGLDVVPSLVKKAKTFGKGSFYCMPYEVVSSKTIDTQFDALVCNFSLLGKTSVEHLLSIAPSLLNPNGYLVIQTLHPVSSNGKYDYQDGWRDGSWLGFSDDFTDPPPWYFRTITSWFSLLIKSGFSLHTFKETINPSNKQIASLILVGKNEK